MSQMTIGKKLMLTFAAMFVVVLGLAVSSIYSIAALGVALDTAVNKTTRKLVLIDQVRMDLVTMRHGLRGGLLYGMHNQADKVESNQQDFEKSVAHLEQLLKELKPILVTAAGQKDAAAIEAQITNLKSFGERTFAAASAGHHQEALAIAVDQFVKSYDDTDKNALDLVEAQKTFLQDSVVSGARTSSLARSTAWSLLALALAISPLVFFTVRLTNKQLREVASRLAEGASQIASASAQIASSSQSLAQGASEQAASLEETSASSEEITSMTRKNAENSQSSAAMVDEVDRRVSQGNQTLEKMVLSMHEINNSSDKIAKIIKVIDEIAFQTNILALNAAVEAARAGEAGMGFAVVADEVRNLAQRSAQAAKDTASLIEESISKSTEGSSKLQEMTHVIRAITESSSKVKILVDEVNLGSQEQARGMEQISKAIAQMDQVTQSTAANAEESASASEEMSAQAEALNSIVLQLRSLVGSDDTASPRLQARS